MKKLLLFLIPFVLFAFATADLKPFDADGSVTFTIKNFGLNTSGSFKDLKGNIKWDAANPDIIKQSKAEYDRKNPIMSFRPTPELIQWLDEERWNDDGKPETDAALIKRKLEKLMKMENQGY